MDNTTDPFTRRMLRRVSLRRDQEQDGMINYSNEDLQRRYNILRAIDAPSTHRGSSVGTNDHERYSQVLETNYHSSKDLIENTCNNNNDYKDSTKIYEKSDETIEKSENCSPKNTLSSYTKSFELGNVKWRGPLYNSIKNKSQDKRKNEDSLENNYLTTNEKNVEEEPAQLLKVRQGNIKIPEKMVAEFTNIDENVEKSNDRKSHEFSGNNETQVTKSSITSLSAAIEDLDVQIKNLEMKSTTTFTTKAVVEMCSRIYPVLTDIKFDSTTHKPENQLNSQDTGFETSKVKSLGKNLRNYEVKYHSNDTKDINSDTFVKYQSDEDGIDYKTPLTSRKMPVMESTRKSSHSDSTKIKFPSPCQVESTISTIANPVTPDSPDYKYSTDKKLKDTVDVFNNTIPYEVEKFLEEALGDELYNTTVTYAASEARDRTNSHFTASELISEDRTPLHRRVMQAINPPMTEPLPTSSSTLNRSIGIYRSLSQRIKRKFRPNLKAKEDLNIEKFSTGTREADRVQELLQEVNIQQTLMNQATKALNLCHTMKEFVESSERVESERLLMLASLRRKAALEEIKRITSEENSNDSNEFIGERGEVTIKDINLNFRDCVQRDSQEIEVIEWFVIVVSQGLKIWATRPINWTSKCARIHFPGTISIPNLTPSFKILLEVYSLKLRKSTYNHEDKYRIRRNGRSSSCPPCPNLLVSPSKLLKKVDRPSSPKIYQNNSHKSRNTSFVLSGFIELFLHDLSLSSPWPLMLVPTNSILQGTIDLSLTCRLHLSESHEGFLNHGDEAGGFATWNRRWCVLKGHTLMFWNYPREQETKDPLTIIELINCISNKITTADRKICAKPRTLLIETVRHRNAADRNSMIVECRPACTIVRNLLSYDSVHELMEWSTKLNHVVLALREWNVIGTRPQPQVSDL